MEGIQPFFKILLIQYTCTLHVLPVLDCLLILHCAQKCCFYHTAENLEQIQIIEGKLFISHFLNENQHHELSIFVNPVNIHRIAVQEIPVYLHLSGHNRLFRFQIIIQTNGFFQHICHSLGCDLKTSIALILSN